MDLAIDFHGTPDDWIRVLICLACFLLGGYVLPFAVRLVLTDAPLAARLSCLVVGCGMVIGILIDRLGHDVTWRTPVGGTYAVLGWVGMIGWRERVTKL